MEYQNEEQMYQENYAPAPSEPKQSPNNMATASLFYLTVKEEKYPLSGSKYQEQY